MVEKIYYNQNKDHEIYTNENNNKNKSLTIMILCTPQPLLNFPFWTIFPCVDMYHNYNKIIYIMSSFNMTCSSHVMTFTDNLIWLQLR